MKKFLLIAMAAASVAGAQAEPTILPNQQILSISPNGKWAASELYEQVTLINLETGEKSTFQDDGSCTYSYMLGVGRCIANNGWTVGATSYSSPAVVFHGSDYTVLPMPDGITQASAVAITPDARYIVGSYYKSNDAMGDVTMTVPCLWESDADGNWGEPLLLPYPELDFTGRAPQYVSANCITDDGSLIIGQVRDFGGGYCYPLLYTKNSEGNWEYEILHPELLNPNNVEFPEWPGEGPESPTMEDYISEEGLAAYNEAVDEFMANYNETGVWDSSAYPEMSNFMTQEEIDAYDAAMAAYTELQEQWDIDFSAFNNAYMACIADGAPFVYNNLHLSADGRLLAVTCQKTYVIGDDPEFGETVIHNTPYVFNLKAGSYSANAGDINHIISGIANDGTILARDPAVMPEASQVCTPDGTYHALADYVSLRNAELGTWVKENMYHDVEVFNPETYETEMKEGVDCTGIAICDPELNYIICNSANYWDFNDPTNYFAYILPLAEDVAVESLGASNKFSAYLKAAGMLQVQGEPALVEIFDMQGRKVFSAEKPAGTVNTGLASGSYIVKAVAEGGAVSISKAVL